VTNVKSDLGIQGTALVARISALRGRLLAQFDELRQEYQTILEIRDEDGRRHNTEYVALIEKIAEFESQLDTALQLGHRPDGGHFAVQLEEARQAALANQAEAERSKDEIGILESRLRQRSEEVEQANSEAEQARDFSDKLAAQLNEVIHIQEALVRKLAESESWVFSLAGERARAEVAIDRVQRAIELERVKNADLLRHIKIEQANHADAQEALQFKLDTAAANLDDAQRKLSDAVRLRKIQEDILAEQARLISQRENELSVAGSERANFAEAQWALESELNAAKASLEDVQRKLNDAVALLKIREDMLAEQARLVSDRDRQLIHAHSEIKTIKQSGDIRQHERDTYAYAARIAERKLAWLNTLHAAEYRFPAWWRFLPNRYQRRLQFGRLARKNIFDAKTYLAANPDVLAEGMDPLYHFVLYGIHEGRRPVDQVLTVEYLSEPDTVSSLPVEPAAESESSPKFVPAVDGRVSSGSDNPLRDEPPLGEREISTPPTSTTIQLHEEILSGEATSRDPPISPAIIATATLPLELSSGERRVYEQLRTAIMVGRIAT